MARRSPHYALTIALVSLASAVVSVPALVEAAPSTAVPAQRTALLPTERLNISAADGRRLRGTLRETLSKRPQLRLLDDSVVAAALIKQPADCSKRPACLRELATALDLTRVLALRAGQLGETSMLRLTLYDRAGVKKGSWQEVLRSGAKGQGKALREALERMVDGLAPRPIRAARRSTPWYKRWWVWTAVGVAVAGAVTTTVLLTRDTRPEADHVIRL
jgi:hypothetical protein